MDTDAIVDRHPTVALVDELAHTNVPGSRRAKRWEDVLDLLATGIDFDPGKQARIEALTSDLSGELHVVDADSVVDGILGFVRRHRVTQCVVGEPLKPVWREVLPGSVVNRLVRQASQIDIHVIARRER